MVVVCFSFVLKKYKKKQISSIFKQIFCHFFHYLFFPFIFHCFSVCLNFKLAFERRNKKFNSKINQHFSDVHTKNLCVLLLFLLFPTQISTALLFLLTIILIKPLLIHLDGFLFIYIHKVDIAMIL